ncbi:choice-of-anchor A domain-containing protein [Sphingobium sp. B7D2B]|uniref:collagen-binding domain-containing protein n=1 Tax=Sphingobium sp. B7D2B TaxID=2940583 RepID=UPI0022256595|nr:collagen-binding domain-containing protein [Sphingobium sp. B7D2B]MCW2366003.1 choice-of-anchor A domain-containing protein [Sphingobium sp. B7D2B]
MLKRSSLAIALGLAAFASAPALASGDAAAGLEALKNYNLIVLGDVNLKHDVEGKMLVGGNLTGASQVGIGNSSQGQTKNAGIPVLTVGGNISNADIKVHNGSNGGVGTIASGGSASVAGNVSNSWLTMNSTPRTVTVGGNFTGSNPNIGNGDVYTIGGSFSGGTINQSGGSLNVGGTASGNFNGGTRNFNLASGNSGYAASVSAPITATVTKVSNDVRALSTALASLNMASNPSGFDITGTAMTLNAVDNGAGYALFSFNAADFASINSLKYNFSGTTPVIINVFGTDVNLGFNSDGANQANNQQVIWNFVNAETLNFSGNIFYGSVLAPSASLLIHTPIEGSVVVGRYTDGNGGEIHLGTFNGNLNLVPVPEPSTWAMMIMGLGLTGLAMRRRAKTVAFA